MKHDLIINGVTHTVKILSQSPDCLSFLYQGTRYDYTLATRDHAEFTLKCSAGTFQRGAIARASAALDTVITLDGYDHHISKAERGVAASSRHHTLPIAPMPGMVQSVLVNAGDMVAKDQPLVVMEAMKMQLTIKAAYDGMVTALHVKAGDAVAKGTLLLTLNESDHV